MILMIIVYSTTIKYRIGIPTNFMITPSVLIFTYILTPIQIQKPTPILTFSSILITPQTMTTPRISKPILTMTSFIHTKDDDSSLKIDNHC